jgi:SAM-dependent methyltransferase
MSTAAHWDAAYARRGPEGVSWFQPTAERSLRLIGSLSLAPEAPIIDAGGGASALVDALLASGARDVSVIDLSAAALAHARARLGADAERVAWIHADVRSWAPPRTHALWHDRAVFHFMATADDRDAYLRTVRAAVAPGGNVVVATFAADGPTQCSGLPVARYDAAGLAAAFGEGFRAIRSEREVHRTPSGSAQAFTWVLFERSDA